MTGAIESQADIERLRAALASVPVLRDRPRHAWRITPLSGLTNRSYRVTSPDGSHDYMLRIPGAGTDRYVVRGNEIHNARVASAAGLAPEIVHADERSGVMLARFLAGAKPLAAGDLAMPEMRRQIAGLLRRLHESVPEFRGTAEPFEVIDRYLAQAADGRLSRLRMRAEAIRAELASLDVALRPCHVDPVPANFLLLPERELLLVDWEFSAMADPMWDIATIVVEGDLDPAAGEALLDAYTGRPDSRRHRKLSLFSLLVHLVAVSWGRAAQVAGNRSDELERLVERHLRVLEAAL